MCRVDYFAGRHHRLRASEPVPEEVDREHFSFLHIRG